ncbi:flavin reductase (DIM6/NTAB) family NADH-FMN oxidoreductase RutF [Prauserella sediminis]|uniref:Flavin reductase (DIM6/NTAB) family NADH-FMN oxidoreductase RutF n=1 Tax=Prauserella sediminis TaxID=577680 RepID=A0A839XLX2_9PSEU|nr:flavin reductase family protein [Prauserella sediminis]MBB3664260.1 flavin reductase (DIM6/NTAB) family NADH-FMN oxidoreductase RutF [Prauserella sediminis]
MSLSTTVAPNGTVDTDAVRATFARFPSGVTAVCALDADGTPIGLAASSFVGVSLDPPLVGVCVQYTSTTWPRLAHRPRLGLSVLAASQDRTCRQLAAKTGDRFAGLDWHATDDGALLLQGATAWLDCSIERTVPAGDHEFVLFRVHEQGSQPQRGPLVFHASGFHTLSRLEHAS